MAMAMLEHYPQPISIMPEKWVLLMLAMTSRPFLFLKQIMPKTI